MLVPGALTRVATNSELKIEELKLTKDGNETGEAMRARLARVELRRGRMIVSFEGFGQFDIETRDVRISVLPSCLFELSVDENRIRLICIRGNLTAIPKAGDKVTTNSGFVYEWPQFRAVVTKEDAQAQAATAEALQVGVELEKLAGDRRDRLPPNF